MVWNYQNVGCSLRKKLYCVVHYNCLSLSSEIFFDESTPLYRPNHDKDVCRLSRVQDKTIFVAKPQRMRRIDAACCYRRRAFRGLSVRLSVCVGHTGELCKNGTTDRAAVCGENSREPKQPCTRAGWTVTPPGKYEWSIRARPRCGLMSKYIDHLSL